MESDLDEKLRTIDLDRDELDSVSWSYVRLSAEQAETIKQAFIDAGWLAPGTSMVVTPKGLPIMTGQEFYDRFEKEIRGKVFTYEAHSDVSVTKAINKCMVAAKKAAGIE